jgi:mono/diheme cytochrome c family protein
MRHPPRLLLIAACCLLPSCQQKMALQPGCRPDRVSSFFEDGRQDRPLEPGVVARGHLRSDVARYTGLRKRPGGAWNLPATVLASLTASPLHPAAITLADQEARYVDEFPFPVTRGVLRHGQNRYMIYCVVCHDASGYGRGKIVERSYTAPPSFHIDRLRRTPAGRIFAVITLGYGSMPEYKQQIPPDDRWAIVAYVRALQLSQHYPEKDLPPEVRKKLHLARGVADRRNAP